MFTWNLVDVKKKQSYMTLRQLVLCVYPNCVKNIQKGTSVFTQFCIRTEIHGTHTVRNIHVVNGRGYTLPGIQWNALRHCFQLVPGIFTLAQGTASTASSASWHVLDRPCDDFAVSRTIGLGLWLGSGLALRLKFGLECSYRQRQAQKIRATVLQTQHIMIKVKIAINTSKP